MGLSHINRLCNLFNVVPTSQRLEINGSLCVIQNGNYAITSLQVLILDADDYGKSEAMDKSLRTKSLKP